MKGSPSLGFQGAFHGLLVAVNWVGSPRAAPECLTEKEWYLGGFSSGWSGVNKDQTLASSTFLHGTGHGCVNSRSTPCFCVAREQLDWIGKSGYVSASEGGKKILTSLSRMWWWGRLELDGNTHSKMKGLLKSIMKQHSMQSRKGGMWCSGRKSSKEQRVKNPNSGPCVLCETLSVLFNLSGISVSSSVKWRW